MRALCSSFVALLFIPFFVFMYIFPITAGAAQAQSADERKVIVGLLQTEKETYPEELTYSYNIYEILTGLGAFVTRIDYNTIVDFNNVRQQALQEAKGDINRMHDIEAQIIKREVAAFLEEKHITRVFIPGNFYNLDTEPYAPTENRQLITAALARIVHENPDIKIMGVCGGLQGVMHAMGVKIVRIHLMVGSHESAAVHSVSMPDPHEKDVVLHRLRIVPGSRLAEIVSKHVEPDENWWYSLFFPDAHGGVVSSDPENIKKLEDLGYKIVGFSDDGIIEALEDKHGNILFQDHPEALAINLLKGNLFTTTTDEEARSATSKGDLRYKAAIAAVSVIEDFLYRK